MIRRAAGVLAAAAMLMAAVAPAGDAATTHANTSGGITVPGGKVSTTPAVTTPSSSPYPPGETMPAASSDGNALVGLGGYQLNLHPEGHRLTGTQARVIAARVAKIVRIRKKFPGSYAGVFMKGTFQWQVSFYAKKKPLREIGQVTIDDPSATVLEAWTGFQVAWVMARGRPGAFGKGVNSVWIWIPLCILFIAPFVNPRRPFRWLHLDLLVLLGFSASLAYFNHAEIGHSVPILYPLFAYLMGRMLWIGLRRNAPDREPLKLLVPANWLIFATAFLIAFRVVLNVLYGGSNVIDVGYASTVGANLLAHGHHVYGAFPANVSTGDTYGPVTYEAYVPFIQAFGFHNNYDTFPAAHAAALTFDLLTVLMLWFFGRRIRGPKLGAALAYAWVSFPFTLFVTNTNTNDGLVALLLVMMLFFASGPALRGIFGTLAAFAKFAPLLLMPLLLTQEARVRPMVKFLIAAAVTTVLVWLPIAWHLASWHDVENIYNRTIGYQQDRGAPFSIWGFPGALGSGPQHVWQAFVVLLALALAVVPRRRDIVGLAALSAVIIIAMQASLTYWFYLYIVWFFPLVMIALLGESAEPARRSGPAPEPVAEAAPLDHEPAPEPVPA